MSYLFVSIFTVFVGCKNEPLGLDFIQTMRKCLNVMYLCYLGLEYFQRRNQQI